jgi:hypothetical protein
MTNPDSPGWLTFPGSGGAPAAAGAGAGRRLPQPQSCRGLHGPQHVPQQGGVDARGRANHRAADLDRNRRATLGRGLVIGLIVDARM